MNKDLRILAVLAHCCVAKEEILLEKLNIDIDILDILINTGLIERDYYETKLEAIAYYVLTNTGESLVLEQLDYIKHIYIGFNFMHDIRLSEFYLNLTECEQQSWKNKKELANIYGSENTIDAAYCASHIHELHGVTVLGNNDTKEKIKLLDDYSKKIGCSMMNYLKC